MLEKLTNYIDKQKKKGFKDGAIHKHLKKYGWHGSHVRQAFSLLTKKHTQRFIAYSIWYILLVFVITISLVQLGQITGFATEESAYCFGEMNGVRTFFDKQSCCRAAENLGCTALQQPLVVRGQSGQPAFWANYKCYDQGITLFFDQQNYLSCS